MKRTPILSIWIMGFLILSAQFACVISSSTETPNPEIQVDGESGLLPNISWITAKANLTPLSSSEAILDSIIINVGVDIPTCGFSSGIEISTYSEGNLVWEKTGRDKVVLTMLALLGLVELPLSKEITVKPDSRVVVTRGNSYIQFDYGILVGTTKSYADGISYCTFFPDLPENPDIQEDINNWSPMPDLQIETYSQGSFRLNIPLGDEPPIPTPISTNTIAPSEACQPLNISDLSFNPKSFARVGTSVEIHAKADWNSCFRAMRLSIDGIIVYELGQPKFTYVWNTTGFNSGDHRIRLEVATQDDNAWLKPSIQEFDYRLFELPPPTPNPSVQPQSSFILLAPQQDGESNCTPPCVFYRNTVEVKVLSVSPGSIILSRYPYGAGEVSTDDEVRIYITHPDGSQTEYIHTYGYPDCIGCVPPTPPVDLSDLFHLGTNTVMIELWDNIDCCYGTLGYYLVGSFEP